MRDRYSNDVFFAGARGPPPVPVYPEAVFYAGRERPQPERHFTERAAATPLRFAAFLFVLGWGGILFQAGFFQQVVFGAPVFEELAKLGLALVVVAALRIRSTALRLLLAWASGGAFGVLEHNLTYAAEDDLTYAGRVVFHGAATGLSMLFYGAFEPIADLRARWAATVPATLFHWSNNFAALVLGVGSLVLPAAETVAAAWSAIVTILVVLATLVALVDLRGFHVTARRALELAMPRLGLAPRTDPQ